MLASVLIFGLNYPMLKHLVDVAPPSVVNVVRLAISCLVLLGLYLYGRGGFHQFFQPLGKAGWWIVPIGVIGYFLSPYCFLLGMSYSSASTAAIILASSPVFTALFGQFLGVERIGTLGWVALGGSLLGSAGVAFGNGLNPDTPSNLFGNAILFLDAVLWGGTIVLKRRVMDRVSAMDLTFWSLVVALPFLGLAAVPDFHTVPVFLERWTYLGALLFSGILGMGLGILWWNDAIHKLGPTSSGLYGNGIPLVGLTASVLFLGEPITSVKVIGVGLIVGGVLLIRWERHRPPHTTVGRLQS
jgi:drug/metabolite transporter (DMT)-like permease